MDKLPMCRICLAENVRMYIVVDRNLRELYERLTDIPFVTKDSRPILACFVCCTQLKKCYRLLKKCLEAEELFARMTNEDFEQKALITQDQFELFHGFIKTPIESTSIDDVGLTESIVVKEELPAVCEGLNYIIEPQEEDDSDNDLYESFLGIVARPFNHFESQTDDDLPLMDIKTRVEEQQKVSKNKQEAKKTNSAPVAKKQKLGTARTKLEDTITAEHKKTDPEMIQNTQIPVLEPFIASQPRVQNSINNTAVYVDCSTNSNQDLSVAQDHLTNDKPYKCEIFQSSFGNQSHFKRHMRTHTSEKSFNCDICQSSFSETYHLKRHMHTHTGEKPFICDICQGSFSQKHHLKIHIMRKHTHETTFNNTAVDIDCNTNSNQDLTVVQDFKPHKCEICQRSFSQKYYLKIHMRTHTREKPYNCNICQSSFSQKSSLTSHMRKHTGERPFKCGICQGSFSHKYYLKIHMRTHTREKPFNCNICQSSFSQKSSLTSHMRTHTGEKSFKCNMCQASFSHKHHLKSHMRTHTREKPFNCNICQSSFSHKSTLTSHMRTHTGEKPFKCGICQGSFIHQHHLKGHMRVHTREKPFNCNICQSSFSHKSSLTSHMRTHTGEKPFKCEICQGSFSQKCHLKIHMRTHTGVKPFKCDKCQRSFSVKNNLASHIRTHDA